jgi:Tol biopolymer transport system component
MLPTPGRVAASTGSFTAVGVPSWRVAYLDAGRPFVVDSSSRKSRALGRGGHGYPSDPHWSPDGASLSFVEGSRLYVVSAAGGTPKSLIPFRGGSAVAWSPDSSRLAVLDGNRLLMIVVGSGRVDSLVRFKNWRRGNPVRPTLAWSPDGRKLACECWRGLYTLSADGSDLRLLVRSDRETDGGVSWSPDGRLIAFKGPCGDVLGDIYCDLDVMAPDGSQRRRLVGVRLEHGPFPDSPSWLPHSNVIATGFNGAHGAVLVNATTGHRRFLPVPSAELLAVGSSSGTIAIECTYTYRCLRKPRLFLIDPRSGRQRRFELPAGVVGTESDLWVR